MGKGGVGVLIYKERGPSWYFLSVEKADLVNLRMFSLKKFTAGVFTVLLGY